MRARFARTVELDRNAIHQRKRRLPALVSGGKTKSGPRQVRTGPDHFHTSCRRSHRWNGSPQLSCVLPRRRLQPAARQIWSSGCLAQAQSQWRRGHLFVRHAPYPHRQRSTCALPQVPGFEPPRQAFIEKAPCVPAFSQIAEICCITQCQEAG